MYKFILEDKYYKTFQVVDTETFQQLDMFQTIDITKSKLFSNDTFNFENNVFSVVHSHVRSHEDIPGVLDMNTTHGKHKDKFLYICKPDDKRIPNFLVPYKQPYAFDKSVKKIYITFSFDHWKDDIPRGSMKQNFGSIEVMNNYYEYILYCKSLNVSIQKFTKEARKKLENTCAEQVINSISNKYDLEYISKKDEFIFTIDSSSSSDHDDAISYNQQMNKVTIYITNVALIMDHLELWSSFTKRISTMYLPDKRRTMLPVLLNEYLLSLDATKDKICYALEIFYDENDNIERHNVKVCKAHISKNYSHEDYELFSKKKSYMKLISLFKVDNSKDLITNMMIYFNEYTAHYLSCEKRGVYRNINNILKKDISFNGEAEHLPVKVLQHICRIRTNSSKYGLYEETEKNTRLYLQASSPIRRLVDILNNISILKMMNFESKAMDNFLEYWTKEEQMEYINISSRSIRKVQSKCQLLAQYFFNKENNISQTYQGYVFDKICKSDGKFQYMVYIPILNLTTYATFLKNIENYTSCEFKLFVFMNQEQDKNKIKLQLCISE